MEGQLTRAVNDDRCPHNILPEIQQIRATISAGQRPDLSSSAAFGAISLAAKSRAVSRIRVCSSVRSKSIAITYQVFSLFGPLLP